MFGKSWEMIKRGMAVALSVSLLAGAMSVSSSLPTAAATNRRVEVGTKGNVTINLNGREVWQAAADAMQKAQPVTGDIADRIMAQTGSNGNPVVLEDDIYKMELPAKALKGLPTGLGMEMYISAGAEDVAEDYTAAEEGEAAAVVAEVASASDLEATGVAEKPVRDFFASSMFSLIKENDEAAPAGGAAAAGGEGYDLNGSEHIYFVLSNATDQDVNYTVKLGDLEILKTKVLKSHGDTTGVIGASVSDLIGVPASTSNMVRATESDMATASNLMEEAELTDDVVAKVVRTTLKNFFIIYRSEETALGTKAMVVTTADMKFKPKDGGVFADRGDKMTLAVRDITDENELQGVANTLAENNVDHDKFAAVDISFRKGGDSKDYEPCQGQIVNVRIETKAMEGFDPETMSIQHHLDNGEVETVAGTTKKTRIDLTDDAEALADGTVTVTEDAQTEITVESDNDGNAYTFDEDANKAAMEAQLSAAGKSDFKMELGDGETPLDNDTGEKSVGKAPAAKKAPKQDVTKNDVNRTVSTAVNEFGVKTETETETAPNGNIKVEEGKVVADFIVDSFSIYTIVADGSTDDFARLKVNFIGVDNTIVESIYVKKKDTTSDKYKDVLYDPGVGEIDDNVVFRGWSLKPDYDKDDTALTIESLRNYIKEHADDKTITDDGVELIAEGHELNVYAMLFKNITVTYIGEGNVSVGSANELLNLNTKSIEYTINMPYTPKEKTEHFEGWHVKNGGNNIEGYDAVTDPLYVNGQKINISGDVTFSVDAPTGYWLVFDEVEPGATYNAPQFLEINELPVKPDSSQMKCYGYTFDDWYTDKNWTTKFDFNSTISDNTTVYAHWLPNSEAKYTVLVWKQNVTNEDEYDFSNSIPLTGTVGEYADVTEQGAGDSKQAIIDGEALAITGFHLGEYDKNVPIRTQGDAVVNVKYDRNDITLNFYVFNHDGGYERTNGYDPHIDYYGRFGNWPNYSYRRIYVYGGSWVYQYGGDYYYYYGDKYIRSGSWQLETSSTGKYGTSLSSNSFTWPTDHDWYSDQYPGGSASGVRTTFLDAYLPSDASSIVNFYGRDVAGTVPIRFHKQNAEGTGYTLTNTVYATAAGFYISDKYNGYYAYEYAVDGGSRKSVGTKDPETGYYNGGETVDYSTSLDIYYNRASYSLLYRDGTYVDGNNNDISDTLAASQKWTDAPHEVANITYGSDMTSYNKGGSNYYEPEIGQFVFEGWYVDDTCTTPYTFTTMPEGLVVYAKWRQKQYRVFLHPNAETDSTLDWGSDKQGMSFRVEVGGKLSMPEGRRQNWQMIGWYLDEDCTQLLNDDAFVLNESTVTTAYDKTEPTEVDKWGNPTETTNKDAAENRFWIEKKLDLYCKWRQKLIGAEGIGIEYDLNGGTGTVSDTLLYLDQADAVAQNAPTTPPEGKQFRYWVVQKYNTSTGEFDDTSVHVVPGDTFTVLKDDARDVEEPSSTAENPIHTYTIKLRAEYGPAEAPTPTHIHWFANNGTDDFITENTDAVTDKTVKDELRVNQAVKIKGADTFEYAGHEFIGWARFDEQDTSDKSKVNEDSPNMFIKYSDGKFYAKDSKTGKFTVEVTAVAADEELPYHDLYAVWKRNPVTLTVAKQLEGSIEYAPHYDSFGIVVTVTDTQNELDKLVELNAGKDGVNVSVSDDNKTANITLTLVSPTNVGGEKKTIKEVVLLAGMQYEVTEKEEYAGYVAEYDENKKSGDEGLVENKETIVTNKAAKITPAGLTLNTAAAKAALLSLFSFAMMCVLGFSLKRRYVSRR